MMTKKNVFVTWFCVTLLLSCMFTNIEARKYSSSKSRGSGSSSSHSHSSSGGHASKHDTSHADAAKLSYSGYNSQPNPPRSASKPAVQQAYSPVQTKPVQTAPVQAAPVHTAPAHTAPVASAPVASAPVQTQPIGWNVPASSNTAGIQKQSASNTNAAPPPYQGSPASQGSYPGGHNAAPPPYAGTSAGQSSYQAPPAYSPHGAPPPSYSANANTQQSGYPAAGGYQAGGGHSAPGAYPAGGGYGAPGGYPAAGGQAGGYPVQSGYPAQGGYAAPGGYPSAGGGAPTVNNYYPQQQQKSGGSGLQTALIAGVGGLALYGALKPSEQKTIIIHEGGETKAAEVPAGVATNPAAEAPKQTEASTATPLAPLPTVPGAVDAAAAPAVIPVAVGAPAVAPVSVAAPIDPNSPAGYPGMPPAAIPYDPNHPAVQPNNGGIPPAPLAPYNGPPPAAPGIPIDPAFAGHTVPDMALNQAPAGYPGMPSYTGQPPNPATYPDGYTPLAPMPVDGASVPLAPFPTNVPSTAVAKELSQAIPVVSNSDEKVMKSAATNVSGVFTCIMLTLVALMMAK